MTAGSGGITVADGVVSNTRPCPDIAVISGGIPSIYVPTQITTLRFMNCTHTFSQNILEITPTASGGGTTYTGGTGISIDTSNEISNTKPMAIVSLDGVSYPDVAVLQLNGFNTSASNANTTLSVAAPTPLNVSIDSNASTTPTGLSFVGVSGVQSNGIVTISGNNFTYYGGTKNKHRRVEYHQL